MEVLYLSPEFPPYSEMFIRRLAERGARVWAIGEADFYAMSEPLRAALKWYVPTALHHPPAVRQAVERLLAVQAAEGYPPGFDLVESHNEQWLRLEAFVNDTFGVPGIVPANLDRIKKKSAMKAVFAACGLTVARGEVVQSVSHGRALAREVGFPLILKPDEGVGAGGIFQVAGMADLEERLPRLTEPYLMEQFVEAPIVTYDGLCDRQGRVIFESSLVYGDGVLAYVHGKDTFFYVNRRIPEGLAPVGRALVAAFDIRRKFFHFEFFRVGEDFLPIEINCRPPGGAILDMMNYSADVDLFDAWARVVMDEPVALPADRPYYCAYLGRRDRDYVLSHADIVDRFGAALVAVAENPPLFQQAMGRYRYLLRTASEAEILGMAEAILAQRSA